MAEVRCPRAPPLALSCAFGLLRVALIHRHYGVDVYKAAAWAQVIGFPLLVYTTWVVWVSRQTPEGVEGTALTWWDRVVRVVTMPRSESGLIASSATGRGDLQFTELMAVARLGSIPLVRPLETQCDVSRAVAIYGALQPRSPDSDSSGVPDLWPLVESLA